ncbi:MAG: 2-C-methyl-D-erythritol 4-phosphate cytidylyltransferase, partial [Dehalococcoidia bacterium]
VSRPSAGAIIVAAGRSQRMGGADKTLAPLAGLPATAHSLRAFADCAGVDAIVLVSGERNHDALMALAEEYGRGKVVAVVPGGAQRQDSVGEGLAALPPTEIVAVHDAARPLVTVAMIERGLALAEQHGAASAAVPARDTIKETRPLPDGTAEVVRTIDRSTLWTVQTPQVFRRDLLARAHAGAAANGLKATDDAMLVESLGQPVVVYDVEGPNLKLTTPDDLTLAAALLLARPQPTPAEG